MRWHEGSACHRPLSHTAGAPVEALTSYKLRSTPIMGQLAAQGLGRAQVGASLVGVALEEVALRDPPSASVQVWRCVIRAGEKAKRRCS